MKKILFISAFSFLQYSFAQQLFCPNNIDESNRIAYNLNAEIKNNPQQRLDNGQTLFVPITIHAIGNTEQDYPNAFDLMASICQINENFNGTNIQFFLANTIQYHTNSAVFGFESNAYLEKLKILTSTYYIPNTINIYFTKINANSDGTYLCGAAPFPSWEDIYLNGKGGILINTDCLEEGAKTITHELGHHFNLLHTFESANGEELVTRNSPLSNCTVAGDGFCDTPADTKNYSCPYQSDGSKDRQGELYNPDWQNYMSYYGNNCLSHFSQEQISEIRQTLLNDPKRNVYLINQPPLTLPPKDFTLTTPSNGSTLPVNEITIRWSIAANANTYLIKMTKISGETVYSNTTTANEITFAFPNNFSGKQYKISVQAINDLNTCQTPIEEHTFSLGAPTTVYQNFIDGVSFKLIPNPAAANGEITVRFNAGFYGQGNISMYDIYGKEKLSTAVNFLRGENNINIPLNQLASGIYLVNIAAEGGSLTKKLVVE